MLRSILAILLLAMVASYGCGWRSAPRSPRPERPSPSETGSRRPRSSATQPAAPSAPPSATDRGTSRATPLPAAAPSPLATINANTPPQVAAATRLANQGRTLLSEEKDDEALEALERAISVDPSNAYAYYFLAELHLRNRSYEQAVAFADRAALLSARLPGSWLTRSYGLQGQALEAAGRITDARAAYRRALAADGGNQVARAGLVRVEARLGTDREDSGD